MKKYIAIALCSVAILCWVGFIWSNSNDTAEESGEKSSQVQEVVNEVAQNLGAKEPVSEHFVRKMAHFSEYLILGILFLVDVRFILSLKKSDAKRLSLGSLISLPAAFIIALIDEFVIQKNAEGRGPSFVDVLIDTSGAIVGLLIAFLLLIAIDALIKYIKNRRVAS